MRKVGMSRLSYSRGCVRLLRRGGLESCAVSMFPSHYRHIEHQLFGWGALFT